MLVRVAVSSFEGVRWFYWCPCCSECRMTEGANSDIKVPHFSMSGTRSVSGAHASEAKIQRFSWPYPGPSPISRVDCVVGRPIAYRGVRTVFECDPPSYDSCSSPKVLCDTRRQFRGFQFLMHDLGVIGWNYLEDGMIKVS